MPVTGVSVCLYVRMYVCMYVCTYVCRGVFCVRVCIYRVYVCIYVEMYVCVCFRVPECMYFCRVFCVYFCRVYVCMFLCRRVFVRTYVRMYVVKCRPQGIQKSVQCACPGRISFMWLCVLLTRNPQLHSFKQGW